MRLIELMSSGSLYQSVKFWVGFFLNSPDLASQKQSKTNAWAKELLFARKDSFPGDADIKYCWKAILSNSSWEYIFDKDSQSVNGLSLMISMSYSFSMASMPRHKNVINTSKTTTLRKSLLRRFWLLSIAIFSNLISLGCFARSRVNRYDPN